MANSSKGAVTANDVDGFDGLSAYLERFKASASTGVAHSRREAKAMLAPKNSGTKLSDLYSDFKD